MGIGFGLLGCGEFSLQGFDMLFKSLLLLEQFGLVLLRLLLETAGFFVHRFGQCIGFGFFLLQQGQQLLVAIDLFISGQ